MPIAVTLMARDKKDPMIDTLQLNDEQWAELSAKLELFRSSEGGQRRHVRVPFRTLSQIVVAIQKPDEQWAKYIARSRDLSEGGIGFLHGAYVHAGSRCRVILKDIDGKPACLEGVVRRCDLLLGRAHVVGVELNEEIVMSRFIPPDTEAAPDTRRDAG